jgi:hypothetical protein
MAAMVFSFGTSGSKGSLMAFAISDDCACGGEPQQSRMGAQ